ncbi:hypothetical protein LFR94_002341 [Vibrio vulnificus]|uniref:hypothetical protein n=1 Tax=Vibrio vulnificus TaxID=672 RepID=UPI001A342F6D|nr:hypothetical protein [Vibrio vulnificus]EGQ7988394.1 hypothetical protein [Vibrio vulnificus]EGQ9237269.1 hypothetical protein [Vibrio vulnificus]EGR7960318.1 hypothetical protein [Vibrio vulnificus]EGR7983268.1 hypothetical protein [Vibrio vulnificus]
MSTDNLPSQKRTSNPAVTIGGAGGLSGILIAFVNIGLDGNEYLAAVTTTIPFVVGLIFAGIDYFLSLVGARSKAELEVDAKLKRRLTQVDQFITECKESIKQSKEAGLCTKIDEESLREFQIQKRNIQLGSVSLPEISIKAVSND